jgi:ADP-ribosyl-[dinitrogen reductase] hydrolase
MAVNLGEDADTTAAVYGQLAGAYYGVDAIPQARRDKLARRDEITALASKLHDLARA